MKPQVVAFSVAIAAALLSLGAIIGGRPIWAAGFLVLTITGWIVTRVSNRRDPIPMPHLLAPFLFLPRGPHSPSQLIRLLNPQPGERCLEVGPGPGVHALPVAKRLVPGGVLDVLDIQAAMLEHLRRRAAQAGITNIVTKQANAHALPYANRTFDAAYMIGTLGEIPDWQGALRELRRVMKPEGRLVIGETFVDPDFVSLSTLKADAGTAGFAFERVSGPRFSYLARFRPQSHS